MSDTRITVEFRGGDEVAEAIADALFRSPPRDPSNTELLASYLDGIEAAAEKHGTTVELLLCSDADDDIEAQLATLPSHEEFLAMRALLAELEG